jgi:hypothetical protein
LRRTLERWKVKAWHRQQRLGPGGRPGLVRVRLWLLSLMSLLRAM